MPLISLHYYIDSTNTQNGKRATSATERHRGPRDVFLQAGGAASCLQGELRLIQYQTQMTSIASCGGLPEG